MRIASIDQGTTSTRSIMVEPDGPKLRVVHTLAHDQIYPKSGWVEHDPDLLVKNILNCIDACGPLDAVGIDNQGESCLAWDAETKEALSPVIVWQDRRTQDLLALMKEQGLEADVLARAGLPIDPYFSASKLGWIVKNLPLAQKALEKGTLRLGTTDAFFLDRLTGHFATDVTTASRTSLMNLKSCQWDQDLCAIFGVPIECLPEIRPTIADFGSIKTDAGSVPVLASIVDQQAALYGFGIRQAGEVKFTFGTGAFALAVTGDDICCRPDLGLLPTVAWQKPGDAPVYALDGGVFSASAAVNWAQSLGLFSKLSDINEFARPAAIERDLAFVPALSGLGCPHWEPGARGSWLGLSIDTTSEELIQAVLEGVAMRATEVLNAMDACVGIDSEIRIDGGMSANPYFVQFLANASGRTIRPSMEAELTGLGTLQLASEAAGETVPMEASFSSCTANRQMDQAIPKFRQAIDLVMRWNT